MTKIRYFGDAYFRRFLRDELAVASQESARDVLAFCVALLDMPMELSGNEEETGALLTRFAEDLSPHDKLWKSIAKFVQIAFPDDSLSEQTDLARAVHQMRYLISSQQAEYVRHHYKKGAMTDAQALAYYLVGKSYSLSESSRLHNKVSKSSQGISGVLEIYNIKVLIHFHSEFILDGQGNFLNELDAQKVTEAGVVNGASFNYSKRNNRRHRALDVHPTRVHDPKFRQDLLKHYKVPTLKEYQTARRNIPSMVKMVKQASRNFKKLVKSMSKWV